jgi:L-cysteine desulfidase
MICDGAKEGCALKVATGVSAAVQAAILARAGVTASANDGIIDNDVERTILNLATVGSKGMAETDRLILDIMVQK